MDNGGIDELVSKLTNLEKKPGDRVEILENLPIADVNRALMQTARGSELHEFIVTFIAKSLVGKSIEEIRARFEQVPDFSEETLLQLEAMRQIVQGLGQQRES
jgi:predicted proteasome-type protease